MYAMYASYVLHATYVTSSTHACNVQLACNVHHRQHTCKQLISCNVHHKQHTCIQCISWMHAMYISGSTYAYKVSNVSPAHEREHWIWHAYMQCTSEACNAYQSNMYTFSLDSFHSTISKQWLPHYTTYIHTNTHRYPGTHMHTYARTHLHTHKRTQTHTNTQRDCRKVLSTSNSTNPTRSSPHYDPTIINTNIPQARARGCGHRSHPQGSNTNCWARTTWSPCTTAVGKTRAAQGLAAWWYTHSYY